MRIRNPILREYYDMLSLVRRVNGHISRSRQADARVRAYKRLIQRHGITAVRRHQALIKSALDRAARAAGYEAHRS